MKNKSKLKKIKKQNKMVQEKNNKKSNVPTEWFYMNEQEVGLEQLEAALSCDNIDEKTPLTDDASECEAVTVQIWKELGVAELEIKDAKSIDVECMEVDLGNDEDNQFLEEHQIKTLWAVTISAEFYEQSLAVMQSVTKKLGGFFCGDTEDFTPVIKNEGGIS